MEMEKQNRILEKTQIEKIELRIVYKMLKFSALFKMFFKKPL